MNASPKILTRRALLVEQAKGSPLYLFALRADEILSIADVSRISRADTGELIGYQRPEVKAHVDGIIEYLNGEDPLFPNALILALSSDVRFRHSRGPAVSDGLASAGTLEIPLPGPGERRPGWIVDGQQRALALSRAKNGALPIPVAAFVADGVDLQRDQFLRVNNTQPLPRGLVTELLPEVSTLLSPRLAARKLPSALVDVLNRSPDSPFCGLVRRASSTGSERKSAVIADTSLVSALVDNLNETSGCLFPYRNLATGETDTEGIWGQLICYWTAVRDTFPDAWGRPPTESRLMHGVGIRAMGRLMNRVMASIDARDPEALNIVAAELGAIAPYCRWTGGIWEELGEVRWDELQNVPKHIRMLSNHLVRLHFQIKRGGR